MYLIFSVWWGQNYFIDPSLRLKLNDLSAPVEGPGLLELTKYRGHGLHGASTPFSDRLCL